MSEINALTSELLSGSHRALAEAITKIENRSSGYRTLVSNLHSHTGNAEVIGITGFPGAGKSTLVDKMADKYRQQGDTVGVIAVDPSSPFSGGAVLGDRIRMRSTVGDMDVFFRSMSARGALGGLSTATTDAVKALDAFGKDKIIVETVGTGQNEIDIVKTADTVAVLVPPASGDDIQMLKAGILEIADIFVVNKADLNGADKTVKELQEMINIQQDSPSIGYHGVSGLNEESTEHETTKNRWKPPVIKLVAKSGDGLEEFISKIEARYQWLDKTGQARSQEKKRYKSEIQQLIREDVATLVEERFQKSGKIDKKVEEIIARETDPYSVADDLMNKIKNSKE